MDGTEVKAAAYVFAREGIAGLAVWVFRRRIDDALARYVTVGAAVASFGLTLILLAFGNRNHIPWLSRLAGLALLIVPVTRLGAWVLRKQRDALAIDHGRDSDAYRQGLDAAARKQAENVTKDDWLIDPPWRRPKAERPRFGRE